MDTLHDYAPGDNKHEFDAEDVRSWFFGIIGVASVGEDDFSVVDGVARLVAVKTPPRPPELLLALEEIGLFGPIVRYGGFITYELRLDKTGKGTAQGCFTIAQSIISAIRIRTLAKFLVPAVANCSWSAFGTASEHSCHVQLVEDMHYDYRPGDSTISTDDLIWVRENIRRFAKLQSDERFETAVEALCTHLHQANLRMRLAMLWAGIEALFGFNQELRFRLSAVIAALLSERGAERCERYRKTRLLYDRRSKAVHGSKMSDDAVRADIADTAKVLSDLLCSIVELGHILSEGELEHALFS